MDNSWKNSEREKRIAAGWPKFRKFLLALLGFNVLMLAWSLFDVFWEAGRVSEIISSIGYVLWISGMIFNNAVIRGKENPRRNNIISLVLWVPAMICISYSIWFNLFAA